MTKDQFEYAYYGKKRKSHQPPKSDHMKKKSSMILSPSMVKKDSSFRINQLNNTSDGINIQQELEKA